MKRTYVGPRATDQEKAERIFATGEGDICQTLVDVTFSPDVDPAWIQDRCFDLLRQDNWMYWGIAAVCLGHLGTRLDIDLASALPLLHAALRHPEAAGQVCDGLSDIRHRHPDLREQEEVKHRAGLAQRIRQWSEARTSSGSLWSELYGFGAREEFPELSALLDPYVENETEPAANDRREIAWETQRVLAKIRARTTTRPRLLGDERSHLRRLLRELAAASDPDHRLDTEIALAIAALSVPEAAIALDILASRDLAAEDIARVLDAIQEPQP